MCGLVGVLLLCCFLLFCLLLLLGRFWFGIVVTWCDLIEFDCLRFVGWACWLFVC